LAFEVARTLRRRGQPQPQRLIVSSRRPPHLPEPFPPMAELPDAEFVAAVQARYGGIPQPILQEPELLALFLPTLRADFSVLESYRYDEEAALACPIDAFSGDEDRIATTAAMRAWERHTTCLFATQQFAGGHFFLQTQRNEVLEVLHGLLRQA
jgi:medium-chain acyl-[acyl-carrier-protein] hydrolase